MILVGASWDLDGNKVTNMAPGTASTDAVNVSQISSLVSGSGTSTRLTFWSNTNNISSDSLLVWDNFNKRVSIGWTTPTAPIDVRAALVASPVEIGWFGSSITNSKGVSVGVHQWGVGYIQGLEKNVGNVDLMLQYAGGNVAVGLGTATSKLHVFGDQKVSGSLFAGGTFGSQKLNVAGGLGVNTYNDGGQYITPDSTSSFYFGAIQSVPTNAVANAGVYFVRASFTFDSQNLSIGEIIYQSRADGVGGQGHIWIVGQTVRMLLRGATINLPGQAGSGNQLAYFDAGGSLFRSTIATNALVTGGTSAVANRVTYWQAAQNLANGVDTFTFDPSTVSLRVGETYLATQQKISVYNGGYEVQYGATPMTPTTNTTIGIGTYSAIPTVGGSHYYYTRFSGVGEGIGQTVFQSRVEGVARGFSWITGITTPTEKMTLNSNGDLLILVGNIVVSSNKIAVNTAVAKWLSVNGGSDTITTEFFHSGAIGGSSIRNTSLANGRTAELHLTLGSTQFGGSDRTYSVKTKGNSTDANFIVSYWNGTAFTDRWTVQSDGKTIFQNANGAFGLNALGYVDLPTFATDPTATGYGGLWFNYNEPARLKLKSASSTVRNILTAEDDLIGSAATVRTASFTLAARDYYCILDSNAGVFTVTLDGTMEEGRTYVFEFRRNGTNLITLSPGTGYDLIVDGISNVGEDGPIDIGASGTGAQKPHGVLFLRRFGTNITIK